MIEGTKHNYSHINHHQTALSSSQTTLSDGDVHIFNNQLNSLKDRLEQLKNTDLNKYALIGYANTKRNIKNLQAFTQNLQDYQKNTSLLNNDRNLSENLTNNINQVIRNFIR